MKRPKSMLAAVCAAVAVLGAATMAQELNTDKTTYVTFSAPVTLPNVTLPAGDYMFKLINSQVNRNVVQIYDHDRSKLFATVMAIPAQRTQVTNDTVITFREAPAGAPPAVRYWYFPGDKAGQEFAYPTKQAQDIADSNHEAVVGVTGTADDPAGVKGGEIKRVEPRGSSGAKSPKNPKTP
jgi:hypothetical protein